MKPNMRRNLSGTFLAQQLGKGAWRLVRDEPPAAEIFLRGAEPAAAAAMAGSAVSDIAIEWRGETVELSLRSDQGAQTLQMQSAIIHEPRLQLYAHLPLAEFDAKARRFWRRVFALVRIPGGRHLLKVLARRVRAAG
jgi:HSP20 family molecular chaperone IbpA